MTNLDIIKEEVKRKLENRRAWGKNHYSLDTIKRMGWKSHERGLVEKAVYELIKEGVLRWYDRGRKAIQLV